MLPSEAMAQASRALSSPHTSAASAGLVPSSANGGAHLNEILTTPSTRGDVWIQDFGPGGSCFAANTTVLLEDGRKIAMHQLRAGQRVS